MEIFQSTFNFTLKVHLAEEWGAVPAYGSYSTGDAVFTGALGTVVNGTHEIGLCFWVQTADRV